MASRLVLCAFVFFAAFLPALPLHAQAVAEPFTIHGVEVDVTGKSANAAKDQALADGQRQAFQTLLDRLCPPKERSRLPKVDGAEYVSDYTIETERTSAVRYIASLTVRFIPAAVKKLFANAGIAMIEPVVHPVVVIPLLRSGGQIQLWEDGNPWRAAWLSQGKGGVVAIVVPQAVDGTLPGADAVVAANDTEIQPLAGRYRTNAVLTVTADLAGDGHRVEVTTTALRGGSVALEPLVYTAKSGEAPEQILARAVRDMVQLIEKQVTQNVALAGAAPQDALSVIVPLSGFEDWMSVRDRLSRGGVVRSWDLVSLSKVEAAIQLHLAVESDKAKSALANLGFDLQAGDGYWLLKTMSAKR